MPDEAAPRHLRRPRPSSDELPGVATTTSSLAPLARKVKGFVPYPDGMIRLKGVTFAQK